MRIGTSLVTSYTLYAYIVFFIVAHYIIAFDLLYVHWLSCLSRIRILILKVRNAALNTT